MSELTLNLVNEPVQRSKRKKGPDRNSGQPLNRNAFKKLKTDGDSSNNDIQKEPFKRKTKLSLLPLFKPKTASDPSQDTKQIEKPTSSPSNQVTVINGMDAKSKSESSNQEKPGNRPIKINWPVGWPVKKKTDDMESNETSQNKSFDVGNDKKSISPAKKNNTVDDAKSNSPSSHETPGNRPIKIKWPDAKKIDHEKSSKTSSVLPSYKKNIGENNHGPSKSGEAKEPGTSFKGKLKNQIPGYVASFFKTMDQVQKVEHLEVTPIAENVFSSRNIKDLPIHPHSIANLEQNMNMKKVTTVQQLSFPVVISGKDALVRSQTGSGKTIAYALPIVESLQKIRPKLQRSDGTRAVIIVPTRELALQTFECFVKLVKPFTWIVPGYLVGGEKKKSEKARLRKGITILIGTPGRLLDHIQTTKNLVLKHVKWLILDEADRLLDMGYEKDVASFVRALNEQQFGDPDGQKERFHPLDVDAPEIDPEVAAKMEASTVKRQTIMLSATLTSSVDRLAGLTLKNPKFVDAAAVHGDNNKEDMELIEQDLVIPDSLTQWYMLCPAKLRLVSLASFIVWKCRMTEGKKMLIFLATQDMVDYHTELFASVLGTREKATDTGDVDVDSDLEDEYGLLNQKDETEAKADEGNPSLIDIEFFKLHGNMSQKDRTDVFKTFRKATSGVLLCTDVAARGLDLPQVDWIVQYTAPGTTADYVHRVGRTARVGSAGSAMVMLAPSESKFVTELQERKVKISEEQLHRSLKHLVPTMQASLPQLKRMGKGKTEFAATKLQLRFEDAVVARRDLHELAKKAYMSFVRFYASYPLETRHVFNFKALHLGHYAKGFAIRDAPSKIGGVGRRQWEDRKAGKFARAGDRPHRIRGGPGSSRGLAGGRGTGRPMDGKVGSGLQGRRPLGPFGAFGAQGKPGKPPAAMPSAHALAKRLNMMSASEFASGVTFKKKGKKGES